MSEPAAAIRLAPSLSSDAVTVDDDGVLPATPFASEDCNVEFFPEESLNSKSVLPFIAAGQHRPDDQPSVPAPTLQLHKRNPFSIAPSAAVDVKLTTDEQASAPIASRRPTVAQVAIAILSIVAVTEFALLASGSRTRQPTSTAPVNGKVAIESTPPGAKISIDGLTRGVTPTTLSLNPGEYTMSLTSGDDIRVVHLVVPLGDSTERFYFNESDAESLGRNPWTTIGKETATSTAGHEVPKQNVPAPVAMTASLPPTGAVGGWVTVDAPVDLQLSEGGAVIGSSETARIMLPVGRHVIEAANASLGYKTSITVQVAAGSVARIKPEIPNGTLNINAIPWADVAIDGKKLGVTPLGDVSLGIGSHDVVFTHPQLGERREKAIVTLNGLNRVSVNLNQR